MPDDIANATTAAPRDRSPLETELGKHGGLLGKLVAEFDALEEKLRSAVRPPGPPANNQVTDEKGVAVPSAHVALVREHQSIVQRMIGRLQDLRDRLEA